MYSINRSRYNYKLVIIIVECTGYIVITLGNLFCYKNTLLTPFFRCLCERICLALDFIAEIITLLQHSQSL